MSNKVSAVVTDYIETNLDWEAQELAKAGVAFAAHQLKFKPEAEVVEKIKDAEVIVVNMVKFDESLISKLPKLKLLIRHGIGYDNVDVAACTKRGIVFAYQPDYCTEEVAEQAIAMLFACARQLPQSRKVLENAAATRQWDFSPIFPLHRLDGQTVGIVGFGRIGSRVHRKLASFGFKFLVNDPYLKPERRPPPEVKMVDLETLCRQSDFVTVHTPLGPETKHIINAQTLAWMKPTAYLINTSRGPMIEHAALVDALKRKQIAGAAIDVFDVEPPPADDPLFTLSNAILTPHIGWASHEAGWEIRKSILADILAFARGQTARCVVNKEVLGKK